MDEDAVCVLIALCPSCWRRSSAGWSDWMRSRRVTLVSSRDALIATLRYITAQRQPWTPSARGEGDLALEMASMPNFNGKLVPIFIDVALWSDVHADCSITTSKAGSQKEMGRIIHWKMTSRDISFAIELLSVNGPLLITSVCGYKQPGASVVNKLVWFGIVWYEWTLTDHKCMRLQPGISLINKPVWVGSFRPVLWALSIKVSLSQCWCQGCGRVAMSVCVICQ